MFKKINRKRGQAIVEWAIILPFLLLILISILELAPMMNTFLKVEKAVQYGARIGAVHGNGNDKIIEAVQFNLQGVDDVAGLSSDSPSTTIHQGGKEGSTYESGRATVSIVPANKHTRVNGGWVLVEMTYDYPVYTPMLQIVLTGFVDPSTGDFPITRYAIYRIE